MKLKDLPGNVSLDAIKVRIPDDWKREALSCGLNTMEVYIVGTWLTGMWVKESLTSERMYPITCFPRVALDWEVVE